MTAASSLRHVLIDAARLFNSGHYFETHEILEEALDAVPDELWELFVGLIQIAVGYHELTQQLRSGAIAMLERGLAQITPFPDDAADLNLDALRRRVRKDLEALRSHGFDTDAFSRRPPRLQPLS